MSFERKRYVEKTNPVDPDDIKKAIRQETSDESGKPAQPEMSDAERKKKVQLIMKNITAHARKHNFMMAEKLREVLYDIAPNAINEIFESGKLIDDEKRIAELKQAKKIPPEQLPESIIVKKLWPGLGKLMSLEENIAIGSRLKNKTFNKKTTIIKKDYKNSRLFYINKGSITVYTGDATVDLKAGCIVGVETFFNMSESRTTAMVLPMSNIDYIDLNDLREVISKHPDVGQKLFNYCSTAANDVNCFDFKGRERRIFSRFAIDGFVSVQMMTSEFDKWGQPFRGRLIDISQGGLAFEAVPTHGLPEDQFKGKTANLVIDPRSLKSSRPLNWRGTVVDFKNVDNEISSLHFKGDKANKYISAIVSKLQEKNRAL